MKVYDKTAACWRRDGEKKKLVEKRIPKRTIPRNRRLLEWIWNRKEWMVDLSVGRSGRHCSGIDVVLFVLGLVWARKKPNRDCTDSHLHVAWSGKLPEIRKIIFFSSLSLPVRKWCWRWRSAPNGSDGGWCWKVKMIQLSGSGRSGGAYRDRIFSSGGVSISITSICGKRISLLMPSVCVVFCKRYGWRWTFF